jgi:hypothetical protein
MRKSLLILAAVVFFAAVQACAADDLTPALRGVLDANFAAVANGDIDAMSKTLHSQSPVYAKTRNAMKDWPFKLKTEVLYFKVIGEDGDFAFARVRTKTTKVSGPEFQDNVTDALHAFKKEGPDWKIWTSLPLTVTLPDQ